MLSAQLSNTVGLGAAEPGQGEEEQQALMKELEDILTEMDMIQIGEYKEMEGNYYMWRAKQLVGVVEMEQGRV